MSLLVGSVALALALLFGGYAARLAGIASVQGRAQLAADAAALPRSQSRAPTGGRLTR
jgi:hypothetical protein